MYKLVPRQQLAAVFAARNLIDNFRPSCLRKPACHACKNRDTVYMGGLTFIWVYFWLETDICVTLAWEL
eukprot:COSAG05_NODE_14559_length_393_cov_1.231293_1_plen_68_part_01